LPRELAESSRDHTLVERRLFWGLRALIFWAPVPFASNRTWAWAILVLWALGMMAVWIVARLKGRVTTPTGYDQTHWPIYCVVIALALIALQLLPLPASVLVWLSPKSLAAYQAATDVPVRWASVSIDRFATAQFLLRAAAYASVFSLTLLLVRRTRHMEALAYAFVYAGVVQAVVGILLHVTGASYTVFYEQIAHQTAKGTFVNRNHFAAFINLCLAMGIGLMIGKLEQQPLRTWRQRLRWLAAVVISEKLRLRIMLVVMVIAVVLTRSRMGNTSFFASLLITGLVALLFFRRSTRATVIFIASLVVIDVMIIGSWVGVENVVKRIQDTSIVTQAQVGEESVEQRIEPGLKSLAIVKDYPWLGTGAGTFYIVFPRYRPPDVVGFFDHAHNDYAQVAVELGYVGFGGALCAAIGLLAAGVITLARRGVPQLVRGMAFGGLMATTTLLIHSWIEFNLQIPAVVVAVAMVEALLLKAFWHHRAYRHEDAAIRSA
jgi:O-antigen ligase